MQRRAPLSRDSRGIKDVLDAERDSLEWAPPALSCEFAVEFFRLSSGLVASHVRPCFEVFVNSIDSVKAGVHQIGCRKLTGLQLETQRRE